MTGRRPNLLVGIYTNKHPEIYTRPATPSHLQHLRFRNYPRTKLQKLSTTSVVLKSWGLKVKNEQTTETIQALFSCNNIIMLDFFHYSQVDEV
ncbi:hypothetical protein Hdeb2414_s0003g00090711 [Helianthus debilis subsp. tardiflorus]